jgi:hypothetical protein
VVRNHQRPRKTARGVLVPPIGPDIHDAGRKFGGVTLAPDAPTSTREGGRARRLLLRLGRVNTFSLTGPHRLPQIGCIGVERTGERRPLCTLLSAR